MNCLFLLLALLQRTFLLLSFLLVPGISAGFVNMALVSPRY